MVGQGGLFKVRGISVQLWERSNRETMIDAKRETEGNF